MSSFRLTGILTGLCLAALATAVWAQARPLAMLDDLQPGSWELRGRGSEAGTVRRICIDSGRKLIQLRHPDMACATIVVEDKPNDVTVQYTCRGQGFGRTHVRRETNVLVQVESQGVVNGLPFTYSAEGRRVGRCGG